MRRFEIAVRSSQKQVDRLFITWVTTYMNLVSNNDSLATWKTKRII